MVQITPGRDDNVQALEWMAARPWCTGELGMMGLSWGGNDAILTAARQPPQLKAIVAVSHSIDSYKHGLSWKGGCILSWNFTRATILLGYHTRPPDPAIVGESRRDMWLERLGGHEPPGPVLPGSPETRRLLGHPYA